MFEYITMMVLGLLLAILGIFNMRGNIASIHWYNRRKVTKENQRLYGKSMGLGTVMIGSSLLLTGVLQLISEQEYWFYILLLGVVVGLGFMVYAQFKYNKGVI